MHDLAVDDAVVDSERGRDGRDRVQLAHAFGRLDPVALAVALGTVSGGALWLATVLLLLRGGPAVGLHLNRLSFFLPGYAVSWPGAFVGLLEAGLVGAALGTLLALFWNVYHRIFVTFVVAKESRREMQEL
jgi:hypothetical protein